MHEVQETTPVRRLNANYMWSATAADRTFDIIDDGLNTGGLDQVVTLDAATSNVNVEPYVTVSETGLYVIQVTGGVAPAAGSSGWFTLGISLDESQIYPQDVKQYASGGAVPRLYLSLTERITAGNGFNITYSWSTAPDGFNADMVIVKLA